MRVRLTPLASADLEGIHNYISAESRQGARKVIREILGKMESLASFPELGPVEPDLAPAGRFRALVVLSYKLIYRVDEDAELVWVLRVWDTRQDPATLSLDESP